MRDLCEPVEGDRPDALAQSVHRVLSQVYQDANHVPLGNRHEFPFNVLLNSLCSVLEAVRSEAPEHLGTYRQMVQLVAQDE